MIKEIIKDKWKLLGYVVVISALIPILITAYELITTDKNSVVFLENFNPLVGILAICYYILLMVLGIVWLVRQIMSILNLKNEKTKTELLHLKSQVNPHFFFNMLNNLYGLVGKDTQKAQELILNLSDMMRYSIYEGEKDFVMLEEEVDYLKKYIELHKMRYHKKIDVLFKDNIQENYKVMPLLFLNLMENAFKHGVETLRENAYVRAKMITNGGDIYFEVENNFDSEIKKDPGIGLKNLKRRLELAYPNKHILSISNTGNLFKAQLTLKQL
jgi:LytS/YehU family sensor histidine kinase